MSGQAARLLLLIVVFAASSGLLWAETSTSSIVSGVFDATGATVAGANATARNAQTGRGRPARSSALDFPSPPAGCNPIEVERVGLGREIREGVVLAVGDRMRPELTVRSGGTLESVTVSVAERP